MGPAEFFSMQGGLPNISDLLRGTGLVTALLLISWGVVKLKLVYLVSVDQGTELIRARWGVAKSYRTNLFGHKKGRLVRLKAGRHLLIRGFHDGWEIPLKEIVITVKRLETRYLGKALMYDNVTIGYMPWTDDSPEGDAAMLRFFLSTRNIDRDDQKSEAMDAKITGTVLSQFSEYQNSCPADEYCFPLVNEGQFLLGVNEVEGVLYKTHGTKLVSLKATLPIWNPAEILAATLKSSNLFGAELLGGELG